MAAVALLLLSGCGVGGTSRWCPALPGIETQLSHEASSDSAVALRQTWQVDGTAKGWELEAPRAVAIDPGSGRIAIADHLHQHVLVYEPGGKQRYRWPATAEQGAQLSAPAALAWGSAGRLRVLDNVLRRISIIDTTGALVDVIAVQDARFEAFEDLWLQGSELVGRSPLVPERADSARTGTVSILRTRKRGSAVETILGVKVLLGTSGREVASSVPVGGVPSVAVLDDSQVVVAGEIPELRFRVYDQTGKVVHQVCRVTNAGGDTARIMRVFVGTDQHIWIQRTPGSVGLLQDRWFGPAGASFDLFGKDGNFQGTIHASQDVRIVAASDRGVIGLREAQAGGVTILGFAALRVNGVK